MFNVLIIEFILLLVMFVIMLLRLIMLQWTSYDTIGSSKDRHNHNHIDITIIVKR